MFRSCRGGLGAYATSECYDPGRPSWYPYWLNTPTEAQCVLAKDILGKYPGVDYKTPYPNPPMPTAPPVPDLPISGNVPSEEVPQIYEEIIAGGSEADKSQLQSFFDRLWIDIEARTRDCSWYQTKGSDNQCHFGSTALWIAAAAGVAAAVYLKR